MDQNLEKYLERQKIDFVEHKHKAVFTVSESEQEKTVRSIPGLRCKTLFLKDEKNKFYLVALAGVKRLDIKTLQDKLGVKKLKFASPAELYEQIRLTPGSVSVFGAINSKEIALVVDKEVWDAPIVGFHPNENTSTLEITRDNFRKYYGSLPNEKEIFEL